MSDGPNARFTQRHQIEYDIQRTPGANADTNYKESWAPNLVNSSFVAKVRWQDRKTFVLDMLGEHRIMGARITRHNPENHPDLDRLYCVGCELVRNLGALTYDAALNNFVKYEQAEYLCTFASFLYELLEDSQIDPTVNGEMTRYVERKAKQIGQSLQVNGIFEYTTPPNDVVKTPPAIHVPYTQHQYVWHYVPGPIDRIVALADVYYGTVNLSQFDNTAADNGFFPETMLYLGLDRERVPTGPAGNEMWKLTHNFAFFKEGWNVAYRPNRAPPPGDWDGIRNRAQPSQPPYLSKEFRNLFSPVVIF